LIRAFFGAWLVIAGAQAYAEDAALLQRGLDERRQGRFEESVLSLQKHLKNSPDDARAWYELGLSYAMDGQYAKAVDAYRLALSKRLDDFQCHCALGVALRETQRPTAALNEARRCLELSPGYAGALNLIGNIQTDLGETDKALQAYQDAVRISPMYANAHFNLGLTLASLGRNKEAEPSFRQAIRLSPEEADLWTGLADCLKRLGRAKEARKAYAQAKNLESSPGARPEKRRHAAAGEHEAWHKDTSERN
jgi:Flp pilus assembly protein TadD